MVNLVAARKCVMFRGSCHLLQNYEIYQNDMSEIATRFAIRVLSFLLKNIEHFGTYRGSKI